jgi:anti-sigma regulatory factor (Ser/Thr protein kinase)
MQGNMSLLLKNDMSELGKLAHALEEYCAVNEIHKDILFKINLALDEVVTNIVSYAYTDGFEHQILIKFSVAGKKFLVTVMDDGIAFNPLVAPSYEFNKSLENREIGGLGIYFVTQVMDVIKYQRLEDHNVLFMQKSL